MQRRRCQRVSFLWLNNKLYYLLVLKDVKRNATIAEKLAISRKTALILDTQEEDLHLGPAPALDQADLILETEDEEEAHPADPDQEGNFYVVHSLYFPFDSRDRSDSRNKHKKDHKRKSHKKHRSSHKKRSRSRSSSRGSKGDHSPRDRENNEKNGDKSRSRSGSK